MGRPAVARLQRRASKAVAGTGETGKQVARNSLCLSIFTLSCGRAGAAAAAAAVAAGSGRAGAGNPGTPADQGRPVKTGSVGVRRCCRRVSDLSPSPVTVPRSRAAVPSVVRSLFVVSFGGGRGP